MILIIRGNKKLYYIYYLAITIKYNLYKDY